MNPFSRNLLANLAAFGIIALLFIGASVYFIIIFAVASAGQKQVTVADNSVLVVNLWMNISDTPPSKSLGDIINESVTGPSVKSLYLLEIIAAINHARDDERIKAIFLYGSLIPKDYGSGLAVVTEFREAIERFKVSGKPVYAYILDPSISDYYLLTTADHLIMDPYGILSINGLASETVYLGDALKRYGIGVQTTRVGKYKSAIEMFTSNQMSPSDREQLTELLYGIWNNLSRKITLSRNIDLAEFKTMVDEKGFLSATEAKNGWFGR